MKQKHRGTRQTQLTKRQFIFGGGGLAATASIRPSHAKAADKEFDIVIIGAGTTGLPTAIFAAERGARVLILEAASYMGGTLLISGARMSAAGTKLQKSLGIQDSPDLHYEDVMNLSKGTVNADLLRLAVDHAAPLFDWLMDNGFEVAEGTPVKRGATHTGQSRARYVWGAQGGTSILEVLEREISPHIASGQVRIEFNTDVVGLEVSDSGTVDGVVARSENGVETTWYGRTIVLASGGYTSNSEMFAELEGTQDWADGTNPYSQGIGITLGRSASGFVRGSEYHLPNFGTIMYDDSIPSSRIANIIHYPPNRQPWEIWVNQHGQRFIQEDIESIDAKEHVMIHQPNERMWVVFDDEIFESAPPVVIRWTREDMVSAFNNEFAFTKADTLGELAERTGIDAANLETTVSQYNAGQSQGKDQFGRQHMPLPIRKPPYYAIRVQTFNLVGCAGLAVDKDLRVLRSDMSAIPNLFAAGELLGAAATMGQSKFGGMIVTPALAFGRLLGRELINLQT